MAPDLLLVNPPQGSNTELPNVALGYIAPTLGMPDVMDLNTGPQPVEMNPLGGLTSKYSLGSVMVYQEVRFSVQSRSRQAAKNYAHAYEVTHPGASVGTITCDLDVQCCYPFITWENDRHVAMANIPSYKSFTSYPAFRQHWSRGDWPYPLLTSIGCPFSCSYCAARNRGWKPRTLAFVTAELEAATSKQGVRCVSILDDCFNLRTLHVLSVCRSLRDFEIPWMCTNGLRADRLTKIQAQAMAESGCVNVALGVETADPELLEKIGKGETIKEIERGVAIATDHFPSVTVYLIVGLPGSSYDVDRRSLDWAASHGVYVHASSFLFSNDEGLAEGTFETGSAHNSGYSAARQEQVSAEMQYFAAPNRNLWETVGRRWRVGKNWGWSTARSYLAMDARKAWRRRHCI